MEKCRLCYCDTNPELSQNIFKTKLDPPPWKIIKQLSKLTVKKADPYTKLVCLQCFDLLREINNFRQTILNTDYRIRHSNEESSKNSNDIFIYSPQNDGLKQELIDVEEDPLKIDNENDNKSNITIDKTVNNEFSLEESTNELLGTFHPNQVTDEGNRQIVYVKEEPTQLDNSGNRYQCGTCKKQFTRIGYLRRHQQFNHNDNGTFYCKICCKQFPYRNALRTHLKTHTIRKQSKIQIRKHFKQQNNQKQYECNVCKQRFARNYILKVHLRTHTGEKPYKCDLCTKTFSHLGNLQAHLKIHTAEKPHKCEICARCFTQKSNLKAHLRVHTGEQPYHCDRCNEKYSHVSSLRRHYKRAHSS